MTLYVCLSVVCDKCVCVSGWTEFCSLLAIVGVYVQVHILSFLYSVLLFDVTET